MLWFWAGGGGGGGRPYSCWEEKRPLTLWGTGSPSSQVPPRAGQCPPGSLWDRVWLEAGLGGQDVGGPPALRVPGRDLSVDVASGHRNCQQG